jgi:uncharacterized membrane protein YcaP (DUF421 family)
MYILINIAMRIMGKRQLGQMQPQELVLTILISELAAIPIQDIALPLINALVPLLVLISLELISSALSVLSPKFRQVINGKPINIVDGGIVNQQNLRRMRMTVDDLQESLREKDVFDIEEVDTAIAETNGKLSVRKKCAFSPPCANTLGLSVKESASPLVVVNGGKFIEENAVKCGITLAQIKKSLEKKGVHMETLFILTAQKGENQFKFIVKEKKDGSRKCVVQSAAL